MKLRNLIARAFRAKVRTPCAAPDAPKPAELLAKRPAARVRTTRRGLLSAGIASLALAPPAIAGSLALLQPGTGYQDIVFARIRGPAPVDTYWYMNGAVVDIGIRGGSPLGLP